MFACCTGDFTEEPAGQEGAGGVEKGESSPRLAQESAPKPPKRSSTPRRDGAPSGFRIIVPDYCRPGQVICVQGPDGQQVEVTVPMGVGPGQPMWVQVQPRASASTAASTAQSSEEEADAMVRVLEQDAHSACEFAQRRLLEEMQMQMALWASAEAAGEGAPESDQLQVAASQPELSQTQATLLAAAEEGNAAQLLVALAEAKKFSVVSISLEEAAKGLRESEEAMLTWRCLRRALREKDRHDLEVWREHAASLGLEVPAVLEQVLEALRGQEQELLQNLEKRRDLEQRLEFAEECGDAELLEQVRREAAFLGIHGAHGGRTHGSQARKEQDVREEDASEPPPPPPAPPPPPSSGAASSAEEAVEDPRSTRELLDECRKRGLDTSGCQVREDLLNLLRAQPSQGSSTSSASPPQAEAQQRPPLPRAVATKVQPPPQQAAGTVWDRRVVPPRYLIHKRYEALFLLGLEPGRLPSASELRSAYRKAALESHPDRQQNHSRQEEAKQLFQRVKDAFDHLTTSVR
ncbi:unnamed protein product [Symbiodinium sp. KB8]|nr:unnamed protein product [Symbiodinium sp. KB8]